MHEIEFAVGCFDDIPVAGFLQRPFRIVARGYEPAIVRRVIDLINRNEYKRRQSPPGVKITPRAFGRDRRYPLASRYVGH